MGTCCSINTFPKQQNLALSNKERWYSENMNFDIQSYKKSIPMFDYYSFQELLRKNWSEIDLFEFTFDRLRPLVMRGIPNSQMKTVLLHIFPQKDGMSEEDYSFLFKESEKSLDLKIKDSLFLTVEGVLAANSILEAIGSEDRDFLLRAIQILLWFLKEQETFEIVRAVHKDTSLPLNDNLIDSAFKYLQECLRDQLNPNIKDLLRDMVSNFLIGYAQPLLYPNLLCYFLADQVLSLLKCSVAMIIQNYDKISAILDSENDWRQIVMDVRHVVYTNTELTSLLLNMNFINFKINYSKVK